MKTFTFDLTEPIEYSHKGELVQGTSITLYAPKPAQRKKAMKLKQVFFQSLPKSDGSERKTNEKESEIDGNMVLFIVAQSDADYADFIETGRSLLCDRNAKINDEEYLTTVTVDKLDLDDMETMIGQYVANFIVKSALKALGNG